jgi:phospho-N-acetylmuramoyl-pentapeptide-transferase
VKLILIAGALALVFSLFGTPALIKVLARRGYGQIIRDDGPVTHHTKRGTPTMGGIIIIFSALFAYLIAHLIFGSAISMSADPDSRTCHRTWLSWIYR